MSEDRNYIQGAGDAHWTDWLAAKLGWTVLLAGCVLCAVAVLLS